MEKDLRVVDCDGYKLTNYRVLCRRGVIWLGQTCNLRCYFCYFADRIASADHPEHAFMPLEKAKAICKTLVDVYHNNAVDIQGGEPTIYPHLEELLEYCNQIGLKPTLITNAVSLVNKDLCGRLKSSGVYDLLVSLHGIGDVYDRIVGVKGASEKQLTGLENCRESGIPFRVNITLTNEALYQLEDLVALSIEKGARVVNFIAFNPFVDQSNDQKRAQKDIPAYRKTAEQLIPAIDLLERHRIEANVRYLPFCVFPSEYRKYVQNFQQIVYDLHEWESASEVWSGAAPQRRTNDPLSSPIDFFQMVQERRSDFLADCQGQGGVFSRVRSGFNAFAKSVGKRLEKKSFTLYRAGYGAHASLKRFMAAVSSGKTFEKDFYLPELGEVIDFSDLEYAYKEYRVLMPKMMHPYAKFETCAQCDLNPICDGFHADYAAIIGFYEATAVKGDGPIYDPRYYMSEQMKVVEKEESHWALPTR